MMNWTLGKLLVEPVSINTLDYQILIHPFIPSNIFKYGIQMTENSFCDEGVVAKFQPQQIHCDVSEHSVSKVTPDTNRYFRYYICLPYPGIYLVSLTMMDLMDLEQP